MNLLLDLFFPKKCVGCGKQDTYFCSECVSNIKQTDLVCPRCERLAVGGQTHPICKRRYGLDGLWSLGIYQDPLRSAIQKLKYKSIRELADILVNIIVEYWARYQPTILDEIKKDGGGGWVIVPVPLFWWRENSRGFNQSELIGKKLAEKLGLEYAEVLKRVRSTKSQTKLTEKERYQNIRNAFELDSSVARLAESKRASLLQNDKVMLIDDVWTTGSTLKECCFILKRSGVRKVWALTLAR